MIPIPYVIAGIAGALLAKRGQPTSDVKKREVIGPRSGQEYQVDDFTRSGIIIVHSPWAIATFERKDGEPGFRYLRGTGDEEALAWMIRDFQ